MKVSSISFLRLTPNLKMKMEKMTSTKVEKGQYYMKIVLFLRMSCHKGTSEFFEFEISGLRHKSSICY